MGGLFGSGSIKTVSRADEEVVIEEQAQALMEEFEGTREAGKDGPGKWEGWRQALSSRLEHEGYFTSASVAWGLEEEPIKGVQEGARALSAAKEVLDTLEEALGGLWLRFRRGGVELGQSAGGHWRVHRLIYCGSWVLDRMLERAEYRKLLVGVVAARMIRQGVEANGAQDEQGWIGGVQAPMPWDGRRQDRPWRRESPPKLGALDEQSGQVIDWLLGQVVARIACSLSLEAMVSVDGTRQDYEIDDQFGAWALNQDGEMAALIMGAIFSTVGLGGAAKDREARWRQACRRATTMGEVEAKALEARSEGVAMVERIDELRGRPELFEQVLEYRIGQSVIRGRLGVAMEVPHRSENGGVAAVMGRGGMFVDDKAQWITLSHEAKREVGRKVGAAATALDEALFERFGEVFDDEVERVVAGMGLDEEFSSPLWRDLSKGEAAMRKAAESDHRERVVGVLREWTVRING